MVELVGPDRLKAVAWLGVRVRSPRLVLAPRRNAWVALRNRPTIRGSLLNMEVSGLWFVLGLSKPSSQESRDGRYYGSVKRRYRSSKTRLNCGAAKAKLPLDERVFNCTACGAPKSPKCPGDVKRAWRGRKDVPLVTLSPGESEPSRRVKAP